MVKTDSTDEGIEDEQRRYLKVQAARRNPPMPAVDMRRGKAIVAEYVAMEKAHDVALIWSYALVPQWLVRAVFPTLARQLDLLVKNMKATDE